AQDRDPVRARRPATERRIGQVVGELGSRHNAAIHQVSAGFRSLAEPAQIVRPAGFGTGAGEPLAAERLRADDGADLVAVDVDVADMDAVDEMLDAALDAGVQAE